MTHILRILDTDTPDPGRVWSAELNCRRSQANLLPEPRNRLYILDDGSTTAIRRPVEHHVMSLMTSGSAAPRWNLRENGQNKLS